MTETEGLSRSGGGQALSYQGHMTLCWDDHSCSGSNRAKRGMGPTLFLGCGGVRLWLIHAAKGSSCFQTAG
jgi:hypothetical protein